MSPRPTASLSLDLDNLWAYQMTHGDEGWEEFGTYLDAVTDVVLPELEARRLAITFFVVGQDAALSVNTDAIASIGRAGHEIGNHSFRHQPWLHRYTLDELHEEFRRTEEALEAVTGQRPVGFRGPGYSLSADVLRVLIDREYLYDCSTLPTVVGPLARRYYFRTAKLSAEQRAERSYLFGSARDGLRQLQPYWWELGDDRMLEIPVTTMPLTRIPIHVSYVLYLAGRSPALARTYFTNSLRLCRLTGLEPSILLHPLDFLGADDVDSLRFFPGMTMPGAVKRKAALTCIDELMRSFDVVTVGAHAARIKQRSRRLAVKPGSESTPRASQAVR